MDEQDDNPTDTLGPFSSMEKVEDHLENNHSNPGGFSEELYVEGNEQRFQEAVNKAKRPGGGNRGRFGSGGRY